MKFIDVGGTYAYIRALLDECAQIVVFKTGGRRLETDQTLTMVFQYAVERGIQVRKRTSEAVVLENGARIVVYPCLSNLRGVYATHAIIDEAGFYHGVCKDNLADVRRNNPTVDIRLARKLLS